MTNTSYPAAWHPDPARRHEFRYWDGEQWTENVSNKGEVSIDEEGKIMANSGETAGTGLIDGGAYGYTTPQEVQAQVAQAQTQDGSIASAIRMPEVPSEVVPPPSYTQNIFTEKILVINQVAKFIELTAEYGIYDQNGIQIGAVREVDQTQSKKIARALLPGDSMMSHTLEITDMNNSVLLVIKKSAGLRKTQIVVERGDGTHVGSLAYKIQVGKAEIKMMCGDEHAGTILAENYRAWDFSIQDSGETEIATITKTWEGLTQAIFSSADNYVVQLKQEIEEPLLSLVLAASLGVDLILKQNDKWLL